MSGCGRERRRVLAVAAAVPLAVFVGALAIGGRPDAAAAAACTSEQAATEAAGMYGGRVLSVTPYDDVFVVRLLINGVVQDVVISRC